MASTWQQPLSLSLFALSLILLLTLPQATECKESPLKAQCSPLYPHSIFRHFRHPHPRLTPPAIAPFTCPLPLDDTIIPDDEEHDPEPISYSPWTHPPTCVMADPKLSAQKGQPVRKYCVYTNSHHDAHGLSLITTPEVAADAGIAIMDEPATVNSTFAAYALKKAFTSTEPHISERDPPYKVIHMPERGGLGVVATRKINKYEEIMVDHAAILIDIKFASVVNAFRGYRLLHAAADQLRRPRWSIYDLAQSTDMAADEVENVLRTNSFWTAVGGVEHMVVYPGISRINHACNPNAYTAFTARTQSASIAAAREIAPGEEITISYIPIGLPTPSRQRLLAKWAFNCTCSLCSSPPSLLSTSDARRTKIESLRDAGTESFQQGRLYEALRYTHQVLGLLPSENLEFLESEQYENLARVYWTLGDGKSGDKHARKSVKLLIEQGFLDKDEKEEYLQGMRRSFWEDNGWDEGEGRFMGKNHKKKKKGAKKGGKNKA